jgi:ABC-type transport system involved in multi-copper enzyme maturation permease subunit
LKTSDASNLAAITPCADDRVTWSLRYPITLSRAHGLRAWCYLVWLCIQRQARVRQMVWSALALLGLMATVVGLTTAGVGWGMGSWHWRWVESVPPALYFEKAPRAEGKSLPGWVSPQPVRLTYDETVTGMEAVARLTPGSASATAVQDGMAGACRVLLKGSAFYVFSNWIVFSIFVGFLLPIWSLSFATEALGGEREGRSLVWLLSRPMPRVSIYLAKFVALLPWSLGLTVGGFAVLCALAGRPGHLALRLYWPAVLGGTLAFCALFHFLGACFRRSAVIALVYSFFLETILGNMPGYMKRLSISFYTRCLMFNAAQEYGVQPEKSSIYLPVDGTTAWCVLAGVTVALLIIGMAVFARLEYQDLT